MEITSRDMPPLVREALVADVACDGSLPGKCAAAAVDVSCKTVSWAIDGKGGTSTAVDEAEAEANEDIAIEDEDEGPDDEFP